MRIFQPNSRISPKLIVTDSLSGEYLPTSPYINHWSVTHEKMYTNYDSLVTAYPDYVSRTLLGNTADVIPVYRYDFTPPRPLEYHNYRFPRIYYQTGIHGHEHKATMAGFYFFKELCELWHTQDALRALRWNVAFTVVPVVNPSGLDVTKRKNMAGNGVDLNRNFAAGWETGGSDVPTSESYKGPYPYSEPETQYIRDIMDNSSDIIFAVDNHNGERLQDGGYGVWTASSIDRIRPLLVGFGHQVTAYMKRSFAFLNQGNVTFSQISIPQDATTTKEWESRSVPSALLEISPIIASSDDYDGDNATREHDLQKFTAYVIGNFFINILRNFETIRGY